MVSTRCEVTLPISLQMALAHAQADLLSTRGELIRFAICRLVNEWDLAKRYDQLDDLTRNVELADRDLFAKTLTEIIAAGAPLVVFDVEGRPF